MAKAWALLLVLLAGCAQPSPDPVHSTPAAVPTPDPHFDVDIRVSEERPDGPPIAAAELFVLPLDAAGAGGGRVLRAGADGVVHLSFAVPTRIAVQASGPTSGWTSEGARIDVGHHVLADGGILVSERDVFVPLFRNELSFHVDASWSTVLAAPGAAHTAAPLAFDDRVRAAYLQRLAAARVDLRWQDTLTERADLAAGLAWDDAVWVEGEAPGPMPLPGQREASFDGMLPAEGRPADLAQARLQAAAVTHSFVLGDLPLSFDVVLRFGGRSPPELPAPCHATICVGPS